MTQRDHHFQAVGFVGLEVDELEGLLARCKMLQEELLGLTINAVGEDPVLESAQNATAYVAGLGDRITECIGLCESAKAELLRYGNGF